MAKEYMESDKFMDMRDLMGKETLTVTDGVTMTLSAIQPPRCFFCKEDANNTLTTEVPFEDNYRRPRTIKLHMCYRCTMAIANTIR